ncbi:hypothetical protein PHLCEN_2v9113 [Hermanssonia centrifuga]|uniref:Uncharacterized protein n=1 Tax=Hermanssonia centrifuga TaxID=98765 RepID=A0A2R6NRP2_9APHY|nr:hypothetical protein PHLCEN_2v9113 [Hermanssonia centrifuga]
MAFIIERNKVSLYDTHIQNGHVSYDYIKKALDSDHEYYGLQINKVWRKAKKGIENED